MTRIGKAWLVGVVAAGCMAGVASAAQIKNMSSSVPYEWKFVGTDGLSLDGYVNGAKDGTEFTSFCIELDENFQSGGTYYYNLNSEAVWGGRNTNVKDPLSKGTTWLYSQFAQGLLDEYTFGDVTDARNMQVAIWMMEDELTSSNPNYSGYNWAKYNANNEFYVLAMANGGKGNASADENGVWALNLWSTDKDLASRTYAEGTYRQDILYYNGSNKVPDGGATLVMLGTVLAGLAVLRRRR